MGVVAHGQRVLIDLCNLTRLGGVGVTEIVKRCADLSALTDHASLTGFGNEVGIHTLRALDKGGKMIAVLLFLVFVGVAVLSQLGQVRAEFREVGLGDQLHQPFLFEGLRGIQTLTAQIKIGRKDAHGFVARHALKQPALLDLLGGKATQSAQLLTLVREELVALGFGSDVGIVCNGRVDRAAPDHDVVNVAVHTGTCLERHCAAAGSGIRGKGRLIGEILCNQHPFARGTRNATVNARVDLIAVLPIHHAADRDAAAPQVRA